MKIPIIFIALCLVLSGCKTRESGGAFLRTSAADTSSSRTKELRKLTQSGFVFPDGKEDDTYEVLEAFSGARQPDEYVRRIEFGSFDDATLWFSNDGMHGGGVMIWKRIFGKWTKAEHFYFL